jgi:hypothetical protein
MTALWETKIPGILELINEGPKCVRILITQSLYRIKYNMDAVRLMVRINEALGLRVL